MVRLFVLVHSPALGPRSWGGVPAALTRAGHEVVVPSLVPAVAAGPPSWSRVSDAVGASRPASVTDVVVVAHSGAGLYVPLLVDRSPAPVVGCVLVDAGLAPPAGTVRVAPPELFEHLRSLADGDLLPPWTGWWSEDDAAPLFPDTVARLAVEAEQPRLPLAHFRQELPVPAGWDARPCAYLAFGDTYADEREEARRRGWPVSTLPGGHLHQLVDPAGVATELLSLLGRAERRRRLRRARRG